MPIGSSLNTDPPQLTDTSATAAAKLVDTLSRIITAVESRVPGAAIDFFGSPMDLQGGAIEAAGYLNLLSQTTDPSDVGSVYNKNGDLWFVSSGGTIRLTEGGTLNAAAIGGIGGDYGGVNPALVSFVDATGIYEFTTDPTVYADLRIDSLRLRTGSGTEVVVSGKAAASGSLTIPTHPGSLSLVAIDSSGELKYDNFQAVQATFTDVTVTGRFHQPEAKVMFTPEEVFVSSGGSVASTLDFGAPGQVVFSTSSGRGLIPLSFLGGLASVTEVGCNFSVASGPGTGTVSIILAVYDHATNGGWVPVTGGTTSHNFAGAAVAAQDLVNTFATPYDISDNSQYSYGIVFQVSSSAGGRSTYLYNTYVKYTR